MTYAGSDGTAIDAFVEAGAKGIVVSTMAPGYVAPREFEDLMRPRNRACHQSTQPEPAAGVLQTSSRRVHGTVLADNLPPQKARVLLTVAQWLWTKSCSVFSISTEQFFAKDWPMGHSNRLGPNAGI